MAEESAKSRREKHRLLLPRTISDPRDERNHLLDGGILLHLLHGRQSLVAENWMRQRGENVVGNIIAPLDTPIGDVSIIQLDERDGGRSDAKVPCAEARAVSFNIAVAVVVGGSSKRDAVAADAAVGRRRDVDDVFAIIMLALPSPSRTTTTMDLPTEARNPSSR